MSASEEINAKLDWLITAVKYLLQQGQEGAVELDDEDNWLDDEFPETTATVNLGVPDPNEHVAVRRRPQPKKKPCPHNRQGLDDAGRLVCARCGLVFTESGVQQNRVGNNGGIIQDPHPPGWAFERSPGASSKNPGTPMVPYSD